MWQCERAPRHRDTLTLCSPAAPRSGLALKFGIDTGAGVIGARTGCLHGLLGLGVGVALCSEPAAQLVLVCKCVLLKHLCFRPLNLCRRGLPRKRWRHLVQPQVRHRRVQYTGLCSSLRSASRSRNSALLRILSLPSIHLPTAPQRRGLCNQGGRPHCAAHPRGHCHAACGGRAGAHRHGARRRGLWKYRRRLSSCRSRGRNSGVTQ